MSLKGFCQHCVVNTTNNHFFVYTARFLQQIWFVDSVVVDSVVGCVVSRLSSSIPSIKAKAALSVSFYTRVPLCVAAHETTGSLPTDDKIENAGVFEFAFRNLLKQFDDSLCLMENSDTATCLL